jgi:phosphoribosylformylglycinamidine synthase
MPHPEAYNHWTNHPDWTRNREKFRRLGQTPECGPTVGIRMLQNAVNSVASR